MKNKLLFPMFIKSSKGGMQKVVIDLMIGLKRNGYECMMFTYKDSELVPLCKSLNINVITAETPSKNRLRLIFEIIKIIYSHKECVLIVNDIYSHLLLSLAPFRKKEIFVSHGGNYQSKGSKFASNSGYASIIAKFFSFKRVKKFVAVSESQKKNLYKNARVSKEKIFVIENGISEFEIKPHSFHAEIRLSVVGYIKPLKNQEVLIHALNILKNRGINVCLNIFGSVYDRQYYNKLKKMIDSYSLNSSVNFWGFVDDRTVIYQNTDILISSSNHEGFGLTIVEAMAAKIPTIAFAGSEGPSTIIKNGINGILVENNDPIDYVDAILKYQDELFKSKIVGNAYISYSSKYSIDVMINNYIKIINNYE